MADVVLHAADGRVGPEAEIAPEFLVDAVAAGEEVGGTRGVGVAFLGPAEEGFADFAGDSVHHVVDVVAPDEEVGGVRGEADVAVGGAEGGEVGIGVLGAEAVGFVAGTAGEAGNLVAAVPAYIRATAAVEGD